MKKVLEDEEILKRRKEHLVSKFEKLMKNSEIIVEPTEEDEVDDEEA